MIMFRLFLIISLLFTTGSCSNTRQDKNNLKISSLSNHLQKKGKSIILVMDFGDSDYQIIEYCDTILTYGIGYVKNANTISNNNIVWNSSYPLIRRKLAVTQQETIQNAISKLKTCSYFDANIAKDNVKYTLYVNYHKVASGYKAFIENFPNDIQTVIKEMLLLASPLYYKNHKS